MQPTGSDLGIRRPELPQHAPINRWRTVKNEPLPTRNECYVGTALVQQPGKVQSRRSGSGNYNIAAVEAVNFTQIAAMRDNLSRKMTEFVRDSLEVKYTDSDCNMVCCQNVSIIKLQLEDI